VNKRKISGIAAFVIVFFAAHHFVGGYFDRQNLNDGFMAAAEELEAKLPMQLDELTTLVAVEYSADNFTYKYQLGLSSDELNQQKAINKLAGSVLKTVCAKEGMVETMKMGGHFTYSYSASDGAHYSSFDVTLNDCEN